MSHNKLGFVSVKIIILVFISLMLSFDKPLADTSETANGSMSCKVKSNKVIRVTEGKSSVFSGFKDEVKVGDALKFEYAATTFGKKGWQYSCELKDGVRDQLYVSVHHLQLVDNISLSDEIRVETDRLVVLGENYQQMISQDSIYCEGIDGNLRLKRYYKSDYEGMYIKDPSPDDYTTQVIALDCRTIKDDIQELINLFQ